MNSGPSPRNGRRNVTNGGSRVTAGQGSGIFFLSRITRCRAVCRPSSGIICDFSALFAVLALVCLDVSLVADPLNKSEVAEPLADPHHVRSVGPVFCVDIDDRPLVA